MTPSPRLIAAPSPPDRRKILALAAAGAVAAVSPSASAADRSPWSNHPKGAMRLVDGWIGADGTRIAGIEIRLPPGYKTYWRHPGDSGVPPTFDFNASINLGMAEVLYPTPGRFDDGAGGTAFGYKDGGVIFPVRVTPADAKQPVILTLKMDYGSCQTMCFLVRGEASLALKATADRPGREAAAIRRFLERVPEARDPGPAFRLLRATDGAGKRLLASVEMAGPPAEALFVEAPDGWFLTANDRPATLPTPQGMISTFAIAVHEKPPVASPPELTWTIVFAGTPFRAISFRRTLDLAVLTP